MQADVRLDPLILGPATSSTEEMIRYSRELDRLIGVQQGKSVGTIGKPCCRDHSPTHGVLYGFHCADEKLDEHLKYEGITTYPCEITRVHGIKIGARVIQQPSDAHSLRWYIDNDSVIRMMRGAPEVLARL